MEGKENVIVMWKIFGGAGIVSLHSIQVLMFCHLRVRELSISKCHEGHLRWSWLTALSVDVAPRLAIWPIRRHLRRPEPDR